MGSDDRAFLGRRQAKVSADAYVRTALRVVENIQLLTAKKAREAFAGGPDYFGEEHLLSRFRAYLAEHNWDSDEAALLAGSLDTTYSLPVRPPRLEENWSLQAPRNPNGEGIPPADAKNEDELEDELEDEVEMKEVIWDAEPDELAEEPWGFVVSVMRGGRHRKLHHLGSCKMLPGVD